MSKSLYHYNSFKKGPMHIKYVYFCHVRFSHRDWFSFPLKVQKKITLSLICYTLYPICNAAAVGIIIVCMFCLKSMRYDTFEIKFLCIFKE